MTEETHARFFYNTGVIANTMLASLVTAVTVAAVISLHQAAPVAMHAGQEALAFFADFKEGEGTTAAENRAAARAAACDRLRAALDQHASKLEVAEILYAKDAEVKR